MERLDDERLCLTTQGVPLDHGFLFSGGEPTISELSLEGVDNH